MTLQVVEEESRRHMTHQGFAEIMNWYKGVSSTMNRDDAKELAENIQSREVTSIAGRELTLLDYLILPVYLSNQYEFEGDELRYEIDKAIMNECNGLLGCSVPIPNAYEFVSSNARSHLRLWVISIRKILSGPIKNSGKLNTTRFDAKGPVNGKEIEFLRKQVGLFITYPRGHGGRQYSELLHKKLGRSAFVREFLLYHDVEDCRQVLGLTPTIIPQNEHSFFRFSTSIASNSFGRIRVFCVSDLESAWICDPLSKGFKRMEKHLPYGNYKRFWNSVKTRTYLSNHDWHLFTSYIYRDLLEAAREIMIEEAQHENLEGTIKYYNRSGTGVLTCKFSEFIELAVGKVIYAILVSKDLAVGVMIRKGTTLGLQGGWQLSSILHHAVLVSILKNSTGHIVKGDDAVVDNPKLVNYFEEASSLLGPPLSIQKSALKNEKPVWLRRVYHKLQDDTWHRYASLVLVDLQAPHVQNKGGNRTHPMGRLPDRATLVNAVSDSIISSDDGHREELTSSRVAELECIWDFLIYYYSINVDDHRESPAHLPSTISYLMPRWAFGRYLSTSSLLVLDGLRFDLFKKKIDCLTLLLPASAESLYENIADQSHDMYSLETFALTNLGSRTDLTPMCCVITEHNAALNIGSPLVFHCNPIYWERTYSVNSLIGENSRQEVIEQFVSDYELMLNRFKKGRLLLVMPVLGTRIGIEDVDTQTRYNSKQIERAILSIRRKEHGFCGCCCGCIGLMGKEELNFGKRIEWRNGPVPKNRLPKLFFTALSIFIEHLNS